MSLPSLPSLPSRPHRASTVVGAIVLSTAMGAASAAPSPPAATDLEAAADQVRAAETAFAQTMADRRFDRFAEFVAEDAVFRGGTLHIGRAAVLEAWKPLFDGPTARFSWKPDLVTVAADGRTALSTGPVANAEGQSATRFMSIWRKDPDGRWRVIVDQGVDR